MGPAMEIIDPLPVDLDAAEIAARLRLDPARAGLDGPGGLAATARRLLEPRAIFEAACVGAKGPGTVEVAGVAFASRVLRRNLERTHNVFPYIVTVGPGLEREAGAQSDLLRQYVLEETANLALEKAVSWLAVRLAERHGLGPLSNLSPGSLEDWPITEQPKLFSIFGDAERAIGVRLTESLLMFPRKSVSGILFPSEEGFVACQLCDRPRCPGRKAGSDHRNSNKDQ